MSATVSAPILPSTCSSSAVRRKAGTRRPWDGAIVGLLSQTPAGGLIDRSKNKPRIVIVAALPVTLSSLSLPIVSGFTMVAATQSVAAAAGAIFAPVTSS